MGSDKKAVEASGADLCDLKVHLAMLQRVTDMLGRSLLIPKSPQRIVSLVPSQTELLCDLGLETAVVGITKFCIHPESWFREKPRVGGTKDVKPDRVAALSPDLILANKEENVREQIEALSPIAPVWVSDIQTLEDALEMIRQVGVITGKESEGSQISGKIEAEFSILRKAARPQRVAYAIWRDPWMWAGGDTFIHEMLCCCGWENVLAEKSRYPETSLEEIVRLKPDRVLLSSEPYPFAEKHLDEVAAAVPDAQIELVDGELFSWYGSRLLQSPAYFQELIDRGLNR